MAFFGFYGWTTKIDTIASCEFGISPFSHDGQTVAQMVSIEDHDLPRGHSGARSRTPE